MATFWLAFGLAFAAGGALSLALAPSHVLWVVPVALGCVAWLYTRSPTVKAAATLGWVFGFGYFLFGLSWLLEPFQVDPERHAWMAPFALAFMAAGLALFWGAAFALATWITSGRQGVFALAVAWSLAELARAYLLTGFPWAGLAQFWVNTPGMALLPLIGPHGVGLVTLIVGVSLANIQKQPVFAVLPLVTALLVMSFWPPAPEVEDSGQVVRLVQPNAPQHQKWDPDLRWDFVRRAVTLSAEGPKPDLIIWPETAVPQLLNYADDTLGAISDRVEGVPMLLGIQREGEGQYYNSAIVLGPDGMVQDIYDKAHLVPFGEYVPFGDLMARFGIYGFASQAGAGYAAGAGAKLLQLPIGNALPLICYEAVFPQDVNASPERPDVLVQVTNDAWFGSQSGPYQHLVQAQMRAAEQGIPMLRAANTGISGLIDPYGQLQSYLPLGQAGALDVTLPKALTATVYSQTGDWPPFLLTLLILTAIRVRQRRIAF